MVNFWGQGLSTYTDERVEGGKEVLDPGEGLMVGIFLPRCFRGHDGQKKKKKKKKNRIGIPTVKTGNPHYDVVPCKETARSGFDRV